MMTQAAQSFITPLTLQTLSQQPVATDLLDPAAELGMPHIELARWPDLILIAPASANTLAKCAQGLASDLISTVYLATNAPVIMAPAMNQQMWQHPSTSRNIAQLEADGVDIIPPASGEQACGENGPGRLPEPDELVKHCIKSLEAQKAPLDPTRKPNDLTGLNITLTAGPTQEPLDPVRFITNKSSGKMGYALAQAAAQRGANVHLISGPTQLPPPSGVTRHAVTTAEEMLTTAIEFGQSCDIFVGVAAVCDFAPAQIAAQKIKKEPAQNTLALQLQKNPDILLAVKDKCQPKLMVGFAAETEQVSAYAREKRRRKQLDVIIANDVSSNHLGFNSDHNAVLLIDDQGETSIPPSSKLAIADLIWDHLSDTFRSKYD